MDDAEKKLSWHEKYERLIIAAHGQEYWDNLLYMNTHTKAEWNAYFVQYCKAHHPERLAGLVGKKGVY